MLYVHTPIEPPGAMSVTAFAKWAGIGRTSAWAELRAGRLMAVKVCGRTLIPYREAERWLTSLPPARPTTAEGAR